MSVNVSEVVDKARFNNYHLLIVVLCGSIIFFDGWDLGAISFAAPQFIKLLGISRPMIGPVFSAGLLGLTLGALLFGLVGDRIGPKRTFILCNVWFAVFTLLTATADSMQTLVTYRFLAGLGLGGATPLSIAVASDYFPKNLRTSLVMIVYIMIAVGQIFGGYAYAFVTAFGWRTIFIIGGILPLILTPVYLAALPEAVEYLVMKGAKPDRIRTILGRLDAGRDFSTATSFVVPRENKEGFTLAQLFQDGRALVTTLLWAVFFSSLLALYFYNTWLPTLLTGSGLSQAQIIAVTTSIQIGGVLGSFAASAVVYRIGNFQTVALGYLLSALAMLVLGHGGTSFGFLFPMALTVGFFLVGTQNALNASSADPYPPSMRATGVGWAIGVGRIASVVSPLIAAALLAFHWQPSQLFAVAAVPTLVASALGYAIMRARAHQGSGAEVPQPAA